MCGPSKAMSNLNNQMQDLNKQIGQQVSSVFGNDTKVFNDLQNEYNNILLAHQGFTQSEINNMNAQTIDQAAAQARNVKAAVGSTNAAIGGGNVSLPSGKAGAETATAEAAVANEESAGLRDIQVKNAELANQNEFKALEGKQASPGIFNNISSLDQTAVGANKQATESQQSVDTANNWWKNAIIGGVTGGIGNLDTTGSSTGGEQGLSLLTGMFAG